MLLLIFLTALPLAGCGSSSNDKLEQIPMAAKGKKPVSPLANSLPPYRLQVGDVIQVRMLLNPELNEEMAVRPDGMISTTIVQDLRAYGKTPNELQQELIKAYKVHLIDPHLNVVVKSFAPSRIYVLGEVANPGEQVSVGPNMTLLQAISRAGGMLNSGDENNVLVYRRGAGEKPEIFRTSYKSVTDGSDPAGDIRLASYDVVFVPRTDIADAYKSFQQNIQQFLPASIGLGYGLP